jgi:Holliday junction DNA helicase RuvA
MIDYIKGTIAELTPTRVVLDNNGIGYRIEISLQTYETLEGKTEAKVYIYHYFRQREDIEMYYGFATKDERELFELIISVSGVGVNSARMMLSSFSAEELREAILSEDVNRIKSVKGIGLKSAQRLILELKDKIVKGEGTASDSSMLFQATSNEAIEEATRALTMLGFSKPNVNKAIQTIIKKNPGAKVEEIIKLALKMM